MAVAGLLALETTGAAAQAPDRTDGGVAAGGEPSGGGAPAPQGGARPGDGGTAGAPPAAAFGSRLDAGMPSSAPDGGMPDRDGGALPPDGGTSGAGWPEDGGDRAPAPPALRAPELIGAPVLPYPKEALSDPATGRVVLRLLIDKDGRVEQAEIAASAGPIFDGAAREAAMRLRFRPAAKAGIPVKARVLYAFTFEPPSQPAVQMPTGAAPKRRPNVPAIEVVVQGHALDGYAVAGASTATKTDTPIMEVPQSIQVVPHQVLEDQQVHGVRDALKNISAVQQSGQDRTGVVDRFMVRGFQLDRERNFYRDGRPFIFSVNLPMDAVERLEFLKGPASVLYGQAEPGGVVNVVLKRPTPRGFVRGILQAGSYDHYRAHVDAGGPAGHRLGYRVNASYLNKGSFRMFQHFEQAAMTGLLEFDPAPWVDLGVTASYQHRVQAADSGLIAGVDVPIGRSYNEPWTRVGAGIAEVGYLATVRLARGWQLRQASSWQRQDIDELRADPGDVATDDTMFAQRGDVNKLLRDRETDRLALYAEANVVGKFRTGPLEHTLLFGADVRRLISGFTENAPIESVGRFNVLEPVYTDAPPARLGASTLRLSRRTLLQAGGFVQDQVDALDWLHLLGGARFDTFLDTVENSRFDSDSLTVVDQNNTGGTLRAGALATLFDGQAVFANLSQGFKPNIDPFFNSLLDPERSTQWEVGTKHGLAGDGLLVTLTAFHLTKTNAVISNPVSQSLNIAGERQSRGIELDVVGDPLPGWSVMGALALLDAEVTEGDPRPLSVVGVGVNDLSGSVPPASAAVSGSLWSVYRAKHGVLRGGRVGAGFNGRSSVVRALGSSSKHAGYVRVDAMLGWSFDLGSHELDAQLNFENFGGVRYFSGQQTNFILAGAPFTVMARVSIDVTTHRGKEGSP